MRDTLLGICFPSDQDQRHTIHSYVSSYVSYRLRPTVNVSSKFVWGSGFPIPGFLNLENGAYYLTATRNIARLAPYQRLDIRMNKSKAFRHAKMVLFVEGINVLNHPNR